MHDMIEVFIFIHPTMRRTHDAVKTIYVDNTRTENSDESEVAPEIICNNV